MWFQKLFGFREETSGRQTHGEGYAKTKSMFDYDPASGVLLSKAVDREFMAGVFSTPSLDELRRDVDITNAREVFPGTLTVEEHVGDVTELHVDNANCFALFQAASQFNCLEFVGPRITPEHGVACYAGDHTQGPACATSCAPGSVVRNYFALDGEGQTRDRQVECLGGVEELLDNAKERYFEVQGGYTMAQDNGLGRLNRKLENNESLMDAIRGRMHIGIQSDTEVTGSSFGARPYAGKESQMVTQAYCSACSVGYASARSDSFAPFASLVLDSAYEATLYAAAANALRNGGAQGSRRVFLTALGGGVFQNDMAWIAGAMERAFKIFRGIGLQVVIVSYGSKEPAFRHLLGDWASS